MTHQVSTTQSPLKLSSVWSICVGLLVALLVINQLTLCNARYLPTRADESRKELIKQMLKELMDMPQQYDTDSRYANSKSRYGLNYANQDAPYGLNINKRSVSNEDLINRRSSS